jgi:DNA processing protein
MLGVQNLGPIVPRQVAEGATSNGAPSATNSAVTESCAGIGSGRATDTISYQRDLRTRDRDGRAERDAWVILLTVPGLGPVTFASLLEAFRSATEVLEIASQPDGAMRLREGVADRSVGESAAVRSGPQLGEDLARRIRDHVAQGATILDLVRSLGLTVVTVDDSAYPERLRRVEMPPPLLFVKGSTEALTGTHAVAVVGTRWPTDKGRLIAGWIGSSLARAGAVVVSGLAVGIDGAAHASVVAEGLPTVAVLGGGHARLFPKAHERLADAIVAAGGAVVAELSPETPATRGTFPRRNRLVSGLSDATVVVEAGTRSGALITAGWALEQGRECFLVPGPMDAPTSAGCHAFLRGFPTQTRIVCGIPELLEDLGLDGDAEGSLNGGSVRAPKPGSVAPTAGPAAVLASLGTVERSLAELLMAGPATADELARRSSLTSAALLSTLTLLELRGLVTGSYGRYRPTGMLARLPGPGPRNGSR